MEPPHYMVQSLRAIIEWSIYFHEDEILKGKFVRDGDEGCHLVIFSNFLVLSRSRQMFRFVCPNGR